VTRKLIVPAPRVGVRAAEYRVEGTATTTDPSVDTDLDTIVLGAGRVITTVSITTFYKPLGGGPERRLARIIARRLVGR
jgi:hypothetical protein